MIWGDRGRSRGGDKPAKSLSRFMAWKVGFGRWGLSNLEVEEAILHWPPIGKCLMGNAIHPVLQLVWVGTPDSGQASAPGPHVP